MLSIIYIIEKNPTKGKHKIHENENSSNPLTANNLRCRRAPPES
ncbi:uncharacterized protein METZ01_LOCUS367703 [marine metagenome]|uniref:Uncharacterized protein n=1 Tax=marine metagenome TaxID=408172 RepID=A0A382SY58_9ZZZZ